jgi:transposase
VKFGEALPEVSAEDWARTPPDSVKAVLAAVLERMTLLDARVRELEDRLNTTSRNSSKPPSSDRPSVPPTPTKRSKRKKGGQKGHPRHTRALLPPEQVDATHVLRPEACRHCQHRLSGADPAPWCHQQIEAPPQLRQVTEWQLHQLACEACGKATRASLPGAARGVFGPRLQALTALLTGRFKLSHQEVPEHACPDSVETPCWRPFRHAARGRYFISTSSTPTTAVTRRS